MGQTNTASIQKFIINTCPDCGFEFGTYDSERVYCNKCQAIHQHFGSDDNIGVPTEGYISKDEAAKTLGLHKSMIYYYAERGNLQLNKNGDVDENSLKVLKQQLAQPCLSPFDLAVARHNTGEVKGYTLKQAAKKLGYIETTVKVKCTRDEILTNKDGTVNKKSIENYIKLREEKRTKLYTCSKCKNEFKLDRFFIHKGVCKKCLLKSARTEKKNEEELEAKALKAKRTETITLKLTPDAKKQVETYIKNNPALKKESFEEAIYYCLRREFGWRWNC